MPINDQKFINQLVQVISNAIILVQEQMGDATGTEKLAEAVKIAKESLEVAGLMVKNKDSSNRLEIELPGIISAIYQICKIFGLLPAVK